MDMDVMQASRHTIECFKMSCEIVCLTAWDYLVIVVLLLVLLFTSFIFI